MKLQQLIQEEDGGIKTSDGEIIIYSSLLRRSKLKTIMFPSSSKVNLEIQKMELRGSQFIPKNANAYLISDCYGSTKYFGKNCKQYTVYAIEFFFILS